MRIYVAGSSQERERYRAAVRGVPVTYDWELDLGRQEAVRAAGEDDVADRLMREAMSRCVVGVSVCDVFVMLVPTTPSRGSWFESGIAYGQLIASMYSVGDASQMDIWGGCFQRHFDTMDDVLAHIGMERKP